MTRLPFFNKYPYTNFEQLNLDWLMNMVGNFDARITKNTNDIHNLDVRVTKNEGDIHNLDIRVTKNETDISGLKTRMDNAESDIDSLESRMDGAESDIDSLESRMDGAESDITIINNRLDGMTVDDMLLPDSEKPVQNKVLYNRFSDISNTLNVHMARINQNTSDIVGLNGYVSRIPIVMANPGGTGTPLNTISIGGTTYEIVGGGGGGSSVTPNPSGPATDELIKIDIDGTIYEIAPASVTPNPQGTAIGNLNSIEINGEKYDIPTTVIDSALDPTSNNAIENSPVAIAIDDINSDISDINSDLSNRGTSLRNVTSSQITSSNRNCYLSELTLTPGTWLITCDFDGRGSNVPSIGCNVLLYDTDVSHKIYRDSGFNLSDNSTASITDVLTITSNLTIKTFIGTSAVIASGNVYNVTTYLNAVRIK